ncbi:alpha/beta fold hydrolase [Cohnella sp.]|uniref:alpha/beta hydrolase family protein n=1 Tax=Cohnella sp. TaxID=1883426 RepID=UPI003561F5D0
MKKIALIATASALLLSAIPLSASAAATFKLNVDGQTVQFSDAQPYKSGKDVMLPLRQTAQALGLKVEYLPASKEASISGPAGTATVKPGSNQALIGGAANVAFGADAAVKSNRMFVPLSFFERALGLRTAVHEDTSTASIFTAKQPPAPDSLIEEEIVVGAGTKYPLPGTLTLPKNASGPLPAVILVHGSGPNDRDETVGLAKPFRDLAWGLAEQGIAVLRYDKRTYAHGQSFTPDMLASFTVKDETVDDAIAAAKLLKADERIDASNVYIVGHSLGGMLAPRIDADGGDFAGLALLAGSPRTLWEIIADQNAAIIATMEEGNPAKTASEALVAAEVEKAKSLAGLTDDEAKAQTLFGIPAYYFKEMDSRGADQIAARLTKPVLVLQGEADVQVYADKDYVQWKETLKNNDKASFKLYPGLNHFFAKSADGKVESQVIQDIADWINKR